VLSTDWLTNRPDGLESAGDDFFISFDLSCGSALLFAGSSGFTGSRRTTAAVLDRSSGFVVCDGSIV